MNVFKTSILIFVAFVIIALWRMMAEASYLPIQGSSNIGIGTNNPQAFLSIVGGNVGIGTWTAAGGNLIINGGANVGIGSAWPGATLDVQGNIRASGTITGTISGGISGLTTGTIPQAASPTSLSNSVITQSSSNIGIGVGSPSAPLEVNGSIISDGSGNSYFSSGNLGVGTTTPQAGFVVTNGNVGIATWTAAGGSLIVATGNVGIGSTAPNGALDVGSGSVCLNHVCNSSWPATISDPWLQSPGVGIGTYGNVGIGTTIPQGGLVVTNGNVGIGTWTPNAQLDMRLDANGAVGPIIKLENEANGGSDEADIQYWDGGAARLKLAFFITGGGQDNMIFYSGTGGSISEAMRIASRNVGIGTFSVSNPSSTFSVVGNIGVGTVFSSPYVSVVHPQAGSMIVEKNVGIGTWLSTNQLDLNGSQAIGAAYAGYSTAPSNGLIVQGSVGLGTSAPTGALEIEGGNVGIGTAFTTTAGLTVMNGNVGIGTWITSPAEISVTEPQNTSQNPSYLMQQWTTNNNFNTTYNVGIDAYGGFMVGSHGSSPGFFTREPYMGIGGVAVVYNDRSANFGGTGSVYDSADYASAFVQNAGNFYFLTAPSGSAGASSSFTTVLTVLNGGNVGIGTTAAISKLSVVGNIGIGTGKSSNYIYTTAPNGGMIVEGNVGFGTTTPQTGFVSMNNVGIGTWTAVGGNLIVNGGGNVGIGSAWPGQTLDVQGTVRDLGEVLTSNVPSTTSNTLYNNSGTLYFNGSAVGGGGGSNYWLQTTGVGIGTYGNVGIGTTTPQGGLVITNGNVGIGTIAPNAKLDVNGSINVANGSSYNAIRSSDGGQVPLIGILASSNTVQLHGGYGTGAPTTMSVQYIDPQGSTDLAILGNGNTGIGITTPLEKLAVTGGVGIGTNSSSSFMNVSAPVGGMIIEGNVGIGTTTPQGSFVVTNGNVGIGTPSPQYPFVVDAGSGNTTNVEFGATAYPANIYISGGRGIISFGTSQGTLIKGSTNYGVGVMTQNTTTPALWVNTDNNVGINSSTPGAQLDVQGTVRMSSGIDTGNLTLTQATETAVNLGSSLSGTVTLNLANGTYFYGTVTGTTTFAVSNNASSGSVASFTLELTNGGSQTINWMSGTRWPGGSAPTLTTSGVDILVCSTRDGATTWRCVEGEANSS